MRTKKFLSILLTLAMVLSLMPTAMATDAGIDTAAELKTAIDNASEGETITLGGNITDASEIITINKKITLDGGNFTLTSTAGRAINIDTTAEVTIKDLTIEGGTGCQRGINIINQAGTTNLNNVNISGVSHYAVHVATSAGAAKVNINNSTLSSYGALAIYGAGTTAVVTDSALTGINTNSYVEGSRNNFSTVAFGGENITITVTGGSITAKSNEGCEEQYIVGHSKDEATGAKVTLNTTMTLEGANATYLNFNLSENTLTVKAEYADELGAKGYEAAIVTEQDTEKFITVYNTLVNALTAAEAGDTVTLLDDVTISEKLSITKNLTIDGNNKTLTYTGSDRAIDVANQAEDDVDLTIQNLTVDCTASYCERGISYNENGTLTLTNVTVEGTCVTYALNLPGKSDNAKVVISGGSYTGNIALNIWGEDMTVTVTDSAMTSVDKSNIENYTAVKLNNDGTTSAEGTTLTITGGSITAYDQNGEPSSAVSNATDTGKITISDTTVIPAGIVEFVAVVTYPNTDNTYSFSTLQGAIDKANKDGANAESVKLIKNIVLTESVTVPDGVTLNLNNKTISAAEGYTLAVSENGKVYTVTPIAVTGVTLDKATLSLTTGGTAALAATVAPADAVNKTVTWTSNNTSVATVDENGKVTAVAPGTATITVTTTDGSFTATCAVTVTAVSSGDSGSSGGSSSSSSTTVKPNTNSPTVSTETTENADGSTTVTETKKDGTTVETTTNTDGSTTTSASKTEVKETSKGTTTTTVTETKTEAADGSTETVKTEEKVVETKDSTTKTTTTETKTEDKTETVKTEEKTVVDEDGNETTTTTSTTQTKLDNGSTGTTTVSSDGTTTAEVKVTTKAVTEAEKAEEPVALPMPQVTATTTTETAPTVEVNVPSSGATVEIPVADVTASTVAVIVHADGTEEIVKTSTVSENGVVVTLEGDATIKIVDNSKEFDDVEKGSTFDDAIAFVSSRELFGGTSANTFSPNENTTRGQLMTVLARLDGEQASGISQGMEWAKENGISDGTNPGGHITRQQLAVMLWRYAGSPDSDHSIEHHTDTDEIADYAETALRWAVENGILGGYSDGSIRPQNPASRAHVAAFMQRYCAALNG